VSSPVRDALESYVTGRMKAERLVIAVSAAYYGDPGNGTRRALQPLIDVIDRASPGIVELGSANGGPGFELRLAERPFPKQYEAELRRAAAAYLGRVAAGTTAGEGGTTGPGLVSRIVAAVRRLFTASA
jgi:hypothetical protein